jgi:hypothetical protein
MPHKLAVSILPSGLRCTWTYRDLLEVGDSFTARFGSLSESWASPSRLFRLHLGDSLDPLVRVAEAAK